MSAARESVFLDLPADFSSLEQARAAILCLPYEKTTSYGKGTQAGPEAIIKASTQVELYDEELDAEPYQVGIATVSPFGDFDDEPEQAVERIASECEKMLKKDKFVVGIGGEHTVTVGMVRAFVKHHPNLWVLQLDAHSDLRDEYEGSPYNHACVMARVQEMCPSVGVGIRSGILGERELLKKDSRLFYAHEMVLNKRWSQQALDALGEPVYISIDLDFFDPALVPAVGTPEPGGLSWYDTLGFLRRICQSRKVVGFDVVELSPRQNLPASDFVAAKLIYKLLAYVFEDQLD